MTIHVVKTGESLYDISKMYDVSISLIVNVNGLKSPNVLIPGLSLYIPDNYLYNRIYQIKPGDTLWKLARRFDTSIEYIFTVNPRINPNQLFIGQKVIVPYQNQMSIETVGFIFPQANGKSFAALNEIANQLSYVAIIAYSFSENGDVYLEADDSVTLTQSKQLNIKPLLMIRNFKEKNFSAELVGKVFENSQSRQRLVTSLVNIIEQKGYEGVSIDFEFIPPPRRKDFISFLTELKSFLGTRILHVNVHSKTEDIPTNPIIGAYDYKAIGEIADIVAVMTIDYGYPTGPPNPIAPIWWVDAVVRYATSLIPPQKLQISLPLYGYDWRISDNKTTAFSALGAQNLAIYKQTVIFYDREAKAPSFKYWKNSEEHIVWFEDIRSYVEKYNLIDYYQLQGTTFWQIRLPSPQNWEYIKRNITVLK